MRLHRSKRGDVTDFIADFLPYLLFVLIIIAFLILFEIKGNTIENTLKVKLEDVTGGYEAVHFLRSQVNVEIDGSDQVMDIADLITYNYPDLDYEDEIKDNATEFFNNWKGKGWRMIITYPNGKIKAYGHDPTGAFFVKSSQAIMLAFISQGKIIRIPKAKVSKTYEHIPLPNGEIIEIKYFLWVIVLG